MPDEVQDPTPAAPSLSGWRTDWSWFQALRDLSDDNADEARCSVAAHLLTLQAARFGELFAAIDDPVRSDVSWTQPTIKSFMEFPFEWDTKVSLRDLDPSTPGRELFIALSLLTASTAILPGKEGMSSLLIPRHIVEILDQFPFEEAGRCVRSWMAVEPAALSYGDDIANPKDWTVIGKGRRGGRFRAALVFKISPRIMDFESKRSGFYTVTALGLRKTPSLQDPANWNEHERAALRETVSRFLAVLHESVCLRRDPPARVQVNLAECNADSIEYFAASSTSRAGIPFLEKVSVKPIEESVWRELPAYALGARGPTLEISDGHGELQLLAPATIKALMLHPDSEQMRNEYLVRRHSQILAEVAGSLEEQGYSIEEIDRKWPMILSRAAMKQGILPRRLLQALETAPSQDAMEARVQDCTWRGMLVGEMLLIVITCGQHHPEHVSIRKAMYLIRRGVEDGRIKRSSLPGTSDAYLLREWKRFMPVAHLWAALKTVVDDPDFADSPEVTVDRDLLASAEVLRRLGEQCFGRGQRVKHGPILDPTRTWRTPADLELPSYEFRIEPLPKWSLDQLARYRARASKAVS